MTRKSFDREMSAALCGLRIQVDGDQVKLIERLLPLNQENMLRGVIVRPVYRTQQTIFTVADSRNLNGPQQLFIHSEDFSVRFFNWPARQVNGHLRPPTLQFAFVQEAHARQAEN